MVRRGETLRDHILDVAKEVFLENGFERASMDMIAARAQTSKRSLYAHFPAKDVLFAAVAERIRELFRGKLRPPENYAETPVEAVTLFCGHFLQLLQWTWIARTCRLGISEAERTPEVSAQLYEAFLAPRGRISPPSSAPGTALRTPRRRRSPTACSAPWCTPRCRRSCSGSAVLTPSSPTGKGWRTTSTSTPSAGT